MGVMTLQEIVEQLRACGFECEAGPLENNVAFQELVRLAEQSTEPPEGNNQPPEEKADAI
jgi:hypothetical protein